VKARKKDAFPALAGNLRQLSNIFRYYPLTGGIPMSTHIFTRLTSNVQLYTAALDQTPILVFQGAELIGSGTIAEITEDTVKVRDEYYMREACTFVYAK
jgi:hypothetical protein